MTTCLECAEGKQTKEDGSTSCATCMAGTFGRDCSACVPGQYRAPTDEDATRCRSCPLGFYQPEMFSASCLPCSPGLFQDATGQAQCQACAMGRFSRVLRASSCEQCKPGTGTVQNGSAFCNDCPRGRFGALGAPCVDCEAQTFTKDSGSDLCAECPAGYISKPAASECLKPEIAKDLAQPLPPSLTTVLGQDNAVLLSWEFEPTVPADASDPLPQPPDGFYVRLSATRDFEESYILPTVKGQATRSVAVVIEPSTFIWLLEQPVYMSVSAYRTLDAVTSEWSKSVACRTCSTCSTCSTCTVVHVAVYMQNMQYMQKLQLHAVTYSYMQYSTCSYMQLHAVTCSTHNALRRIQSNTLFFVLS